MWKLKYSDQHFHSIILSFESTMQCCCFLLSDRSWTIERLSTMVNTSTSNVQIRIQKQQSFKNRTTMADCCSIPVVLFLYSIRTTQCLSTNTLVECDKSPEIISACPSQRDLYHKCKLNQVRYFWQNWIDEHLPDAEKDEDEEDWIPNINHFRISKYFFTVFLLCLFLFFFRLYSLILEAECVEIKHYDSSWFKTAEQKSHEFLQHCLRSCK